MKLIIATNNEGKVKEFKKIFADKNFEIRSLKDENINIEVEETGPTFKENAYIKAKAVYDITKNAVIADDSGIEVDFLNGRPGVYSARYAPENQRCEKLLSEMVNAPENKRTARFKCAICYINETGNEQFFEGICEGTIGYEKMGTNGFGYDPVFMVDKEKSMAMLSSEEKNGISHRGIALKKLLEVLK